MGQGQSGVPYGPEIGMHGGSVVAVNIYDLGEEWLGLNNLFSEVLPIGGAFHVGVEAHGVEWSFGSDGISCIKPRCKQNHIYRETIDVGVTRCNPQQVAFLVYQVMSPHWNGHEYDMLKKNCCMFCRELVKRLCGNDIPAWVDRFAQIGKFVSNDYDKAFGKNALSDLLFRGGDDEDEAGFRRYLRHPASYHHPLGMPPPNHSMQLPMANMQQPHHSMPGMVPHPMLPPGAMLVCP